MPCKPYPRRSALIAALSFSACACGLASAAPAAVWTDHSPKSDFELNGVAWTGSRLVAVGSDPDSGNIVYTSADGVAWAKQAIAGTTGDGLNAVCWTGKQLVAVGPQGNVLTSPDGKAWTQRANTWPEEWVGVAWTDSLLIAVTGLGNILTSPDGITWTRRFGGSGPQVDFNSVAWGGGMAVAVGGSSAQKADGVVYTSPDGLAWTKRSVDGAPGLRGAAWTGSMWAAVGGVFDGVGDIRASRLSATSGDGQAWTAAPDSAAAFLQATVWAGTQLVAVGWDGARLGSPDGLAWANLATDTLPRLQAVVWTGNQVVAVGWGSTIVTMPAERPVAMRPYQASKRSWIRVEGDGRHGRNVLGRSQPSERAARRYPGLTR